MNTFKLIHTLSLLSVGVGDGSGQPDKYLHPKYCENRACRRMRTEFPTNRSPHSEEALSVETPDISNEDTKGPFDEIIDVDIQTDKYLHEIQKKHIEIIKMHNLLEDKLYHLGQSMENAINEKKVHLEDTKKILGWREVQDFIREQYSRETERSKWSWQGSWNSKFKRFITEGPSGWFY